MRSFDAVECVLYVVVGFVAIYFFRLRSLWRSDASPLASTVLFVFFYEFDNSRFCLSFTRVPNNPRLYEIYSLQVWCIDWFWEMVISVMYPCSKSDR